MKTLILFTNIFVAVIALILLPASSAYAQACVWTASGDFVCGGGQAGYDFPETVLTGLPPVYDPNDDPVDPIDVGDIDLNIDGAMVAIMLAFESLSMCEQIDAAPIFDAFILDLEEQYPDDFNAQQEAANAYPPPYVETINGQKYFLGEPIRSYPWYYVYDEVSGECVLPPDQEIIAINEIIDNLPACQQDEARQILEDLYPQIQSRDIEVTPPYTEEIDGVTYFLDTPLSLPSNYIPNVLTGNCGPPMAEINAAINALPECQQADAQAVLAALQADIDSMAVIVWPPYVTEDAGVTSFLEQALATPPDHVPDPITDICGPP